MWLRNCLDRVFQLSPTPVRVLVVGRGEDIESKSVVDEFPGADWVEVATAGFVAPIRVAIEATTSEFLAVIDDDAEPTNPDWLAQLFDVARATGVACVGSRVIEETVSQRIVTSRSGCITWYGRILGNVAGRQDELPVEVDTLPEGNWIWRTEVLRGLAIGDVFDDGDASMYGCDLCQQAKAAGWKVLYTREAPINHYSAPRGDSSAIDRGDRARLAYTYARNVTYIGWCHFGWRLPAFLIWSTLVGDSGMPGLAVTIRDVARSSGHGHVLRASFLGRIAGTRAWVRGRRGRSRTRDEGSR